MFIAQFFLCSALANKCVGLHHGTVIVRIFSACEKRIEEMVADAGNFMPNHQALHVGITKLPGFSV